MITALTGFMACGKTTFGKAAATALNCKFIDLDDEITRRYGTPATIFSQGGEVLFRKRESEVLSEVIAIPDNAVLALGGGTALFPANRQMMRERNVSIIWLDTSFDIILSELNNSERPLVKSKSEKEIRALYDTRRPQYEKIADKRVVIDSTDYSKAIEEITEVLRTILCL